MESPTLSEFDLYLLAEGRHWHIYNVLGAHPMTHEGTEGVRFAVWAPSAKAVSVVGDFNHWQADADAMQLHEGFGVWSVFIPMPKRILKTLSSLGVKLAKILVVVSLKLA